MFSVRLKELREKAGYSQAQLAMKLGVRQSTVGMWENGANRPQNARLETLASMFGVSTDYLLGRSNDKGGDDAPHVSPGAVRVPVLGTIPAGLPLEAIEDIIDWEEIPKEWTRGGREFFGLKITGNSMSPRYEDGDVVIFRRAESCESGDDCAVMVNSDDATFKRVRISEKGMALIPLNPEYETRFYTNEEVRELPIRIIGVVYELRRRLRR